ncbi:hypothetical protein GPECTOR_2g937 [Gonium pectorale]|uniref:Uncharacterized protein n=1 Tax=Gonium pectorale TaxID=33097 RepID=A0A150H1X2_GONPE|nr:hypothetical protein GPECTOR_2g937 [Gonium pectorale]|eukprot:KXZ56055.1 hypothetical protein GPECTOR_2g937 [Gonium pectorale]
MLRGLAPAVRHLYALVFGVFIVYYPFGNGVFSVLPLAVLAYLALVLAPRRAGAVAWCTVFPYLILLHVMNASGDAWKTGEMDFTGGAMVAVLKLIAMCASRQDSFRKNKEDLSAYQASHALASSPTPLEFVSYLFGLGNLLSGPFIEFADYKDFIELKGLWSPTAPRPPPGGLLQGARTFAEGLLYVTAYLVLTGRGWGMEHYTSPWYYAQPLPLRCGTFLLIGLVFQLRYYFSWKMAEAGYVFAGLDFADWDEETGKAKWGRCRNADFLGVWLADSARNVPLYWNIGTGIFLRRYVYERITPKGRKPGFPALLFTQSVSGVWHGLYPGYIMFFVGTAVWIYFSQVLFKAETYMPAGLRKSLPYRAVKTLWTAFVLNYMASAFVLLDYKSSKEALSSLNYFPFILMAIVDMLGSFIKAKRVPKPPVDTPAAAAAATSRVFAKAE